MGAMIANLERAAHLIGVHVEHAARDLGITQAEAHVLVRLARRGSTTIAAVHREFGTKRSTLTNVLDRLEARGLVRRELNPADRRSFTIHLTRSGATQAHRLASVMDELEGVILDMVSARDVEGVDAVVHALAVATAVSQTGDVRTAGRAGLES
jgi:MarR family transcriptional regulator, organic hydroperoxide resistance regulator